MRKSGETKVEGGKLLRIEVDFDYTINWVKITGDFFLHPEEAITDLENQFKGLGTHEPDRVFEARIQKLLKEKQIQLLGFTPGDLVALLKRTVV